MPCPVACVRAECGEVDRGTPRDDSGPVCRCRARHQAVHSGVEFTRTHKLELLWRRARNLLTEVCPDDDPARVDDVERVLMQLQSVDPTSEHFRYPVTRDGSPTLDAPSTRPYAPVHETMKGVANCFDGTGTGLREMIDTENEARAAMYDLYEP